jgi:hypothetical protein
VRVKTFILIQAEPHADVPALVSDVARIPGVEWAQPVRGPYDVIAEATDDVDLASVTSVNGVLHALASPTVVPANVA